MVAKAGGCKTRCDQCFENRVASTRLHVRDMRKKQTSDLVEWNLSKSDRLFSLMLLLVQCRTDDFWCANGIGCIDQASVCDNVIQCLDGSDELHCRKLRVNCVMIQLTVESR